MPDWFGSANVFFPYSLSCLETRFSQIRKYFVPKLWKSTSYLNAKNEGCSPPLHKYICYADLKCVTDRYIWLNCGNRATPGWNQGTKYSKYARHRHKWGRFGLWSKDQYDKALLTKDFFQRNPCQAYLLFLLWFIFQALPPVATLWRLWFLMNPFQTFFPLCNSHNAIFTSSSKC